VAPQSGLVLLSSLTAEPAQVRARGAGHEAFLHLFARPFDLAAVTAFQLEDTDAAQLRWNQEVLDARARQTQRRKIALGAFSLSAATAAVGAGFWWSGHNIYLNANKNGSVSSGMGPSNSANSQIDQRNLMSRVLFGVAGASAITGAVLYFWPSAPHVSASSTPDCGVCLAYQRSF
jgi:hypothetical protein